MNSRLFLTWFLVSIAMVFATFPGQLHAEDPTSILQTHEITDSDTGTSAAASTELMDQLISSLDA